jgi:hypothetical protein
VRKKTARAREKLWRDGLREGYVRVYDFGEKASRVELEKLPKGNF